MNRELVASGSASSLALQVSDCLLCSGNCLQFAAPFKVALLSDPLDADTPLTVFKVLIRKGSLHPGVGGRRPYLVLCLK